MRTKELASTQYSFRFCELPCESLWLAAAVQIEAYVFFYLYVTLAYACLSACLCVCLFVCLTVWLFSYLLMFCGCGVTVLSAIEKNRSYEMSSLSETTAAAHLKQNPVEFVK